MKIFKLFCRPIFHPIQTMGIQKLNMIHNQISLPFSFPCWLFPLPFHDEHILPSNQEQVVIYQPMDNCFHHKPLHNTNKVDCLSLYSSCYIVEAYSTFQSIGVLSFTFLIASSAVLANVFLISISPVGFLHSTYQRFSCISFCILPHTDIVFFTP